MHILFNNALEWGTLPEKRFLVLGTGVGLSLARNLEELWLVEHTGTQASLPFFDSILWPNWKHE